MKLIGFAGKAGAGKDTAGAVLVEKFGYERIAFADAVKEAALALDPIIETDFHNQEQWRLSELVEFEGWEKAKKTQEVRRTLQRLGTEVGRNMFDPDIWVKFAIRKLIDSMGNKFVFTDVRFPNEATMLKKHGATLVWIERPGLKELPGNHESESDTVRGVCDIVLLNDGCLEEFLQRIVEWEGGVGIC